MSQHFNEKMELIGRKLMQDILYMSTICLSINRRNIDICRNQHNTYSATYLFYRDKEFAVQSNDNICLMTML